MRRGFSHDVLPSPVSRKGRCLGCLRRARLYQSHRHCPAGFALPAPQLPVPCEREGRAGGASGQLAAYHTIIISGLEVVREETEVWIAWATPAPCSAAVDTTDRNPFTDRQETFATGCRLVHLPVSGLHRDISTHRNSVGRSQGPDNMEGQRWGIDPFT